MSSLAALSDKGRRARKNEDSILAAALPGSAYLLAVADGVGGERAGEIASKTVTDTLRDALDGRPLSQPLDDLRSAIGAANVSVWQRSQADDRVRGMASTVVAALVAGGQAWLANVGDSRAYLIEGAAIRQITDDHSLVAERVREGDLTEEEAKQSRARHIITRSIGSDESVEVDVFGPIALPPGSRLLLCSDGLHDVVPEDEIASIVGTLSPEDATHELVRAANERGGPDNISVVVYRESSSGATIVTPIPRRGSAKRKNGIVLGGITGGAIVALAATVLAAGAYGGGGSMASVGAGAKPATQNPAVFVSKSPGNTAAGVFIGAAATQDAARALSARGDAPVVTETPPEPSVPTPTVGLDAAPPPPTSTSSPSNAVPTPGVGRTPPAQTPAAVATATKAAPPGTCAPSTPAPTSTPAAQTRSNGARDGHVQSAAASPTMPVTSC